MTDFIIQRSKLQFRVSEGERYVSYLFWRQDSTLTRFLISGKSSEFRFQRDEKLESIRGSLDYLNVHMLSGEMSFEVAVKLARKMYKHRDPARMAEWSIRKTIAAVVAEAIKC